MTRVKKVSVITLILFLFFVFDKLTAQISVLPATSVKPGEKAVLSVNVIDTDSKIAKILMVVRKYPEYTYVLNDNGENGDVRAKDGIWSIEIQVPYDATPGKYNLDCELYDGDGNSIITKSETGKETKHPITIIVNVF